MFAHELGHALGFGHVDDPQALMSVGGSYVTSTPSVIERHHAALAYRRSAGNMDLDVDPQTAQTFSAPIVVD